MAMTLPSLASPPAFIFSLFRRPTPNSSTTSETTTSIHCSASPSQPMDHPHSKKRVAVCGGGVIGVCTAYFLAKKGAAVTLIEKSSVACAASGKAGGFLALDWCDGGALSSLARASFNLHRSLSEELDGPEKYGYRPLTTLSLTVTESQTSTSPSRGSNSVLPSWVDGPAKSPRTIGSSETTAQVHPQLFTKTLLNKAVNDYGVEVVIGKVERVGGVEGGRVDAVVVEGGRVIEADAVVLALGPWSGKFEMLSSIFRVHGLKAHSIVVEPKEGAAITPHALFLSYYPAQGGKPLDPEVYPRPTGEVYLCGMSSEQEVPDNPEEISGDPASIQVLKRVARTVSSHLGEGEAQVKTEQACFLPCTDDSVPVIGEIPGAKGCYVATGHSCWGILNGPATGAALAELVIDGHASIVDLSRFSPARFVQRRKV
ncbi:hypothetical protein JRO89_XS08G0206000 [Xanthoceras sorbifolium]|uniref:FAD dependent oxidoreductase domain-containing protein n=1 Tax=Xanthoceras sorbifolium TaxID=99658 RepID=A0ABQ8HQK3_9ROSI|nr:hypothetical protein JRO89_XS08G0206000 [Xanthoceras sorbifolium]